MPGDGINRKQPKTRNAPARRGPAPAKAGTRPGRTQLVPMHSEHDSRPPFPASPERTQFQDKGAEMSSTLGNSRDPTFTRKPLSPRIPFLPEGDDLIAAHAIHYRIEYNAFAIQMAEIGLFEPGDPGLCAGALVPDAPVGAARPGLVAEVRAMLQKIQKVDVAVSVPLTKTLGRIERTLARHRRGPLEPALAADLARALERTMLLLPGPRDLCEEVATLVALLSDTAVLTARHRSFNGFCSDLAAKSHYYDLRAIAGSLTRDGTLPADDPRARLSIDSLAGAYEGLARADEDDVAEYIDAVLEGANKAQPRLASCSTRAFAPRRLSGMVDDLWSTMKQGLLLADQPGLDFMRALARVAEGLGMNLHLQGREEYREIVDRLLTVATLLIYRSYPIAFHIKCRAAGVDPAIGRSGPPPEPFLIAALDGN